MATMTGIRFEKTVADRFRSFSRTKAPSHTEALKILLEHYSISEQIAERNSSKSLKVLLERSDMNANRIIAIVRKIEGEKIDHIHGMLKVLFGYSSKTEENDTGKGRVTSKTKEGMIDFDKAFDFLKIKEEKLKLVGDLAVTREGIHTLLKEKTEVVKPSFGKPYVKLLVSPEELERLVKSYSTKT